MQKIAACVCMCVCENSAVFLIYVEFGLQFNAKHCNSLGQKYFWTCVLVSHVIWFFLTSLDPASLMPPLLDPADFSFSVDDGRPFSPCFHQSAQVDPVSHTNEGNASFTEQYWKDLVDHNQKALGDALEENSQVWKEGIAENLQTIQPRSHFTSKCLGANACI